MYFIIGEEGIIETDRKGFEENSGGVGIFDEEEWSMELKLKEKFSLSRDEEKVFFCKMETYASYLFGLFHVPIKKKERRSFDFAVYILTDRLIFIEEDSRIKEMIDLIRRRVGEGHYSMGEFLSDFFMALVEEDILYLASLEREIAEMEEMVLQGKTEHFHYRMLSIKKEISRLYCYYCQMTDVGDVLSVKQRICSNFLDRVDRIKQEAQSLREYAMQVQDVYQSEISIHQNNIMKFLTVVTTIFLPLTLIAGWYGMNFYNMPELNWQYGYPVVSAISLLVIIVSLWFFKKKKFF
ncbi:MAG: magnesium and cobalt transporter CorA [Eubacterium sp.]|jgi:magnesium transporter|nr:magnesium and cobalt transporter CorA [Eubacterium sp.]